MVDTLHDEHEALYEKLSKQLDDAPTIDAPALKARLEALEKIMDVQRIAVPSDFGAIKRKLDAELFGLEEPKNAIMRSLASRMVLNQGRALLLVGKPGVGKTAISKAIGRALNLPVRVVGFGGAWDEALVKGVDASYRSSGPGLSRFIAESGIANMVIVLDEIDKVCSASQHNLAGTFLDLLDPTQASRFRDWYYDFDTDLFQVLFIATANSLDGMDEPLLDRMEVIHVDGYSQKEKQEIARKYVLPSLVKGTPYEGKISLDRGALEFVSDLCPVKGIRGMQKGIEKIVETMIVQGTKEGVVNRDMAQFILRHDEKQTFMALPSVPGVANALVDVGGEMKVIPVEVSFRKDDYEHVSIFGGDDGLWQDNVRAAIRAVSIIAGTAMGDVAVNFCTHHLIKDDNCALAVAVAAWSAITERIIPSDVAFSGVVTITGHIREEAGYVPRVGIPGIRGVFVPSGVDVVKSSTICPVESLSHLFAMLSKRERERAAS